MATDEDGKLAYEDIFSNNALLFGVIVLYYRYVEITYQLREKELGV